MLPSAPYLLTGRSLIRRPATPIILVNSTNNYSTWGTINASFNSNSETDPLGGTTAMSWNSASAAFADLRSTADSFTVTGGVVYSLTGYLKIVNGSNDAVHGAFLRVGDMNGADANAFGSSFDVVAGNVGNTFLTGDGSLVSASIVSAGGGWWKCSIVGSLASSHTGGGVDVGLCNITTLAGAPIGTRLYQWNIGT